MISSNPLTNLDITNQGLTIVNPINGTTYANFCGNHYILGGYNVLGYSSAIKKTYSNLPVHYLARLTFYFIKIDIWNNNQVIIIIDSIPIPINLIFNNSMDSSIMKMCGKSTESEAIRPIDVVFNHSLTQLLLEIKTDLPLTSQSSWGINDLTLTLFKCFSLCQSCVGPDITDCLSCITSYYLKSDPGPSSCVTSCLDGYYKNTTTFTCQVCDPKCKTCFGNGKNQCLSCQTGENLLENTCINTDCPAGYFCEKFVCLKCDATCKTCSGLSSSECLSCELPRYYFGNTCYLTCPSYFYGENSTNSCSEKCPNDTYADATTKVCTKCSLSCLTCSGYLENQCASCPTGIFLEEGKCVEKCSPGYYPDYVSNTCKSTFSFLSF